MAEMGSDGMTDKGVGEEIGLPSPSELRRTYDSMLDDVIECNDGLRMCERDVMSLLEYETDWNGVHNAMGNAGLTGADVEWYVRNMILSNMGKARSAVSSFSDATYAEAKAHWQETHVVTDGEETISI